MFGRYPRGLQNLVEFVECFVDNPAISSEELDEFYNYHCNYLPYSPQKDINAKYQNQTALHIACAKGNPQFVAWLLDHGASIEIKDDQGNNALHHAVLNQHIVIASLLIESLRKKDEEEQENPSQMAAFDSVITAKNNKGQNPFSLALINNDLEMARFLLHSGPVKCALDIKIKDPNMRNFLLDNGLQFEEKAANVLRYILNCLNSNLKDVDVNRLEQIYKTNTNLECANDHKQTALHFAAYAGFSQAVRWLLNHGANPVAQDDEGRTSLTIACEIEDKNKIITNSTKHSIVDLLLDFTHGADINLQLTRGYNPLILFVKGKSSSLVKKLLSHHLIEINLQDTWKGLTALHVAVMQNSKSKCEMLLRHGADKSIKDKSGKTPMDYASPEIQEILNDPKIEKSRLEAIEARKNNKRRYNPVYDYLVHCDENKITPNVNVIEFINREAANKIPHNIVGRETFFLTLPALNDLTPYAFAERRNFSHVCQWLKNKNLTESFNFWDLFRREQEPSLIELETALVRDYLSRGLDYSTRRSENEKKNHLRAYWADGLGYDLRSSFIGWAIKKRWSRTFNWFLDKKVNLSNETFNYLDAILLALEHRQFVMIERMLNDNLNSKSLDLKNILFQVLKNPPQFQNIPDAESYWRILTTLSHYVDLSAQDDLGNTIFYYVVKLYPHAKDFIQQLIISKATPEILNKANNWGLTPLIFAQETDNVLYDLLCEFLQNASETKIVVGVEQTQSTRLYPDLSDQQQAESPIYQPMSLNEIQAMQGANENPNPTAYASHRNESPIELVSFPDTDSSDVLSNNIQHAELLTTTSEQVRSQPVSPRPLNVELDDIQLLERYYLTNDLQALREIVKRNHPHSNLAYLLLEKKLTNLEAAPLKKQNEMELIPFQDYPLIASEKLNEVPDASRYCLVDDSPLPSSSSFVENPNENLIELDSPSAPLQDNIESLFDLYSIADETSVKSLAEKAYEDSDMGEIAYELLKYLAEEKHNQHAISALSEWDAQEIIANCEVLISHLAESVADAAEIKRYRIKISSLLENLTEPKYTGVKVKLLKDFNAVAQTHIGYHYRNQLQALLFHPQPKDLLTDQNTAIQLITDPMQKR